MRHLTATTFLLLGGCADLSFATRGVPIGALYTDVRANERVTENPLGSKTGESCASSILGLFVTGDASVAAATRAGGITRVASVDDHFHHVLGVYASYCVVVTGD